MPRLILTALALLGACAAPAPGLRDPAAPIWSAAAFDARSLGGGWHQIADIGAGPGCPPGRLDFSPDGGAVSGRLCLAGRSRDLSGRVVAVGPGRLRLPGIAEPLWVLWIDGDGRTMAVGTPSGAFALILDRTPAGSPDRTRAAREILGFNGYRL